MSEKISAEYQHFSSIKDNRRRGSVGSFLNAEIEENSIISIVSAYFTIYAYHKLKNKLDNIKHLNFLFGEPRFIANVTQDNKNYKEFKIEDDNIVIPIESRLIQKAVAKECAAWIKKKVNIKSMVKPNFLHGKMYHIEKQSGIQKAVVGSSNFTVNGLGLGGTPNIELNMEVNDDRDRAELKNWFYEIWNDNSGIVKDVKDDVLKYMEQLYMENPPQFIYFKTLFHLFEAFLSEQRDTGILNEKTGFFETKIWNMLYSFQKDAVKGIINKIDKHNGCIIADSVGLGKTFEALAVIKYFELLNKKVLVLCPKKLSENWTVYQAQNNSPMNPLLEDRFCYTVLCHTDLSRESGKSIGNIELSTLNWGNFDLVVIDESHNFRNNASGRRDENGNIRKTRYEKLMDDIINSGVDTKVLLLSATPVNTNLKDLRNQLYLISGGKDNAFAEKTGVTSLSQTIKNAQTVFTHWSDSKRNPERNVKDLLERLDSAFFKLLDELTIARSRKHEEYYKEEMERIGAFPERLPVISKAPKIDITGQFPSYDKINEKILSYKLSLFNPAAYVREEYIKEYEEKAGDARTPAFKQRDREHFLIGMMKINFLKRLESSIESFEISMTRTIDKISALEERIKNFMESSSQTDEFEIPDTDGFEDEELDEANSVGKKLKYNLKHLNLELWLEDLKKDKASLQKLKELASCVTPDKDGKLEELKKIIETKVKHPLNKNNKKILIFTAFSDTAGYLYENLKDFIHNKLKLHIALVTGSGTNKTTLGKSDFQTILTNFSPVSKNRAKSNAKNIPQEEEIDILIATDCISEGQNLQDCDYLINYDIHWNPVRIIQRFGRIDRLGSKNSKIQLVNFWPTDDLNNYINLRDRVEARMALVDITATGEENILEPKQIKDLIKEDLKFRNRQLKKLKNEVLDLEDMDDNISLTEFTLDDFRVELMNYIEKNREKLENAPFGLYAVVPAPKGEYDNMLQRKNISEKAKEIIKPGVIFCLKQKKTPDGSEKVNPLSPYFLVYIRDDNTVRFNYTHPKQILEIFRLLASGKDTPYEELCDIFNKETDNGYKMDKYSRLLKTAIAEINRVFRKKSNIRLTNNRQALIIPNLQSDDDTHYIFELITWLVIR